MKSFTLAILLAILLAAAPAAAGPLDWLAQLNPLAQLDRITLGPLTFGNADSSVSASAGIAEGRATARASVDLWRLACLGVAELCPTEAPE